MRGAAFSDSSGPRLGWVALSRNALAAAEKLVKDDELGVRDEVGVLAIHRGYSDRFFPGTSVQHSRIRYVLFVAWQLHALLTDPSIKSGSQASKALDRTEFELAGALYRKGLPGVIGGQTATNQGRLTSLPPSAAYWSALSEWGVLSGGPVDAPSKREVFAAWRAWAERPMGERGLTDDESGLLYRRLSLFDALPKPPEGWPTSEASLTFTLRKKEREHLSKWLSAQRRDDGSPTLLANLVNQGFMAEKGARKRPWHADVLAASDASDRAALKRAGDASALAGILRGLYNACVEAVRDTRDGVSHNKHRLQLQKLIHRHAKATARVEPSVLAQDGLSLGDLPSILKQTQEWLVETPDEPLRARAWLGEWESARKGDRARLPTSSAAKGRRVDWTAQAARPLDYRWWVVVSMLDDLGGIHGE